MDNKKNKLHYNVTVCYEDNGKKLEDILKDSFLLHLKQTIIADKLKESHILN
ncbi:MAG: hypothetical protein IJ568_05045 [Bacilli bacterium]|nr:hypothetical protein [Bacilli bacterium]